MASITLRNLRFHTKNKQQQQHKQQQKEEQQQKKQGQNQFFAFKRKYK